MNIVDPAGSSRVPYRALIPLALALGASGCQRAKLEQAGSTTTGGVPIVSYDHSRSEAPQATRLAAEVVANLGGLDDRQLDAELGPNAIGQFLSDGGVVVLDYPYVKYFDAAGKFLRRVGRPGSGPGEFAIQVSSMCATPGDTVIIPSIEDYRLTSFDGAGNLVKQTTFDPIYGVRLYGCSRRAFVLGIGDSLKEDRGWTTKRLVALGVDGRASPTIGSIPDRAMVRLPNGEESLLGAAFAFKGGVAVLEGARPGDLEIYQVDTTLTLKRVIRTKEPVTEVRLAVSDSLAKSSVEPTFLSNIIDLRIDRAGFVWVLDPLADGSSGWASDSPLAGSWTKFDSAGRLIGRATLSNPPGLTCSRLDDIEADKMLLRCDDDSGAPHLVVMKLAARP